MTRLDDAISVALCIMLLIGVPFLLRFNEVMSSDAESIIAFGNSGWLQVIAVTLVVCTGIVIWGYLNE